MAPVTLLLGSFDVCTRRPGPSLTITSSISLTLPPGWEANVSTTNLYEEVKNGNLWITKAGTCSLEITYDPNQEGSAVPQDVRGDISRQLASAVEHCPIWGDLGLDLDRRSQFSLDTGPHEQTTFCIKHLDSDSELSVPEGIPCASLSALSCLLSIQDKPYDQRKQKRSTHTRELKCESQRVKRRYPGRGQTHLSQNSQRSSQDTEAYSQESASQASEYLNNADSQHTTGLAFDNDVITKLVNGVLYPLLGIKKQVVGIKPIGEIPSPTLIEIAPAVWSSSYLRARGARSRFLPAITAVLGGLINAESPRLRRKVSSLLDIHPSEVRDDVNDMQSEIRRRLEVQLQRNLSFDPFSRRRDRQDNNSSGSAEAGNPLDDGLPAGEPVDWQTGTNREDDNVTPPDQQQMSQRSLQDVANDIDALHDEMATMLGCYSNGYLPYHDLQDVRDPYHEYHEGFAEDEPEYWSDPQVILSGPPVTRGQNDGGNAGYQQFTFSEIQNFGPSQPQDEYFEWNDDQEQFYDLQDGVDAYQEFNGPENALQPSDDSAYTWTHDGNISFTADLNLSQPRDLEELPMAGEMDVHDDASFCEHFSAEAGFGYRRYPGLDV